MNSKYVKEKNSLASINFLLIILFHFIVTLSFKNLKFNVFQKETPLNYSHTVLQAQCFHVTLRLKPQIGDA